MHSMIPPSGGVWRLETALVDPCAAFSKSERDGRVDETVVGQGYRSCDIDGMLKSSTAGDWDAPYHPHSRIAQHQNLALMFFPRFLKVSRRHENAVWTWPLCEQVSLR